MSKVVPLREGFENPKAFMHHISEDEEITSFVMVVFKKNGDVGTAQINCTGADIAYASLILQKLVLDDE